MGAMAIGRASQGLGEFRLEEPRAVTAGFFPDHIVSEHGEEVPNVVHRGQLPDRDRIVVIKLR